MCAACGVCVIAAGGRGFLTSGSRAYATHVPLFPWGGRLGPSPAHTHNFLTGHAACPYAYDTHHCNARLPPAAGTRAAALAPPFRRCP